MEADVQVCLVSYFLDFKMTHILKLPLIYLMVFRKIFKSKYECSIFKQKHLPKADLNKHKIAECLDTQRTVFGHTANSVWTHNEQCLDTERTLFGHTRNSVWTHSEQCLDTQRTVFGYRANSVWTHNEQCLDTQRTVFGNTTNSVWTHNEQFLYTQ